MEEAVLLKVLNESREAEVHDLEVTFLVEEEILWLEVAVVDPTGMAKIDCRDQLLEVHPGEVLIETALGDLGEELATVDELNGKWILLLEAMISLSSTMFGCFTIFMTEISRFTCSVMLRISFALAPKTEKHQQLHFLHTNNPRSTQTTYTR